MSKVWVWGVKTPPERYNNYSLINAFRNKGHDVEYFDFSKIQINPDINTRIEFPMIYEERLLSKPDMAIFSDPIFNKKEDNTYLNTLVPSLGFKIFNHPEKHWRTNNKVTLYRDLKNTTVPFLKTIEIPSDHTDGILNTAVSSLGGYPVVLKNPVTTMGIGVYLCNNFTDLKNNIQIVQQELGDYPFILQEYFDTNGIVLCVRVIDQKVYTRMMLSSPYSNQEFKGNLQSGRSYIACNNIPEVDALAINATKAMGLDIARVDIFLDQQNNPIICEVNSLGSIMVTDVTFNIDVASEIADYCLAKL